MKAPLTEKWLPSSHYKIEMQWYNACQGRGIPALLSNLPRDLTVNSASQATEQAPSMFNED